MAGTIKLKDGGNEFTFEIRKMSATQGEEWLLRAVHLLGAQIDFESIANGGNATIAGLIKALCGIPFKDAKDLLNELLGCCYRINGKMKTQVTVEDADTFLTSPATLIKLRIEAAKANFDFFTELKDLISLGNPSI